MNEGTEPLRKIALIGSGSPEIGMAVADAYNRMVEKERGIVIVTVDSYSDSIFERAKPPIVPGILLKSVKPQDALPNITRSKHRNSKKKKRKK